MELLNGLIDSTNFLTVRQHLMCGRAITTVVLVRHREALARVAATLTGEDGYTAGRRRQQWADWWAAGEVETACGGRGSGVDLDAIPDDTTCDVIFLPPVYLVCLRDFLLPVGPRPEP
jgi:hypothetical protein